MNQVIPEASKYVYYVAHDIQLYAKHWHLCDNIMAQDVHLFLVS